MTLNILIAGAGAVGQVYAWHLAQAGHKVHFFVKSAYVKDLEAGLTLYRLGYGLIFGHTKSKVQHLSDFGVLSDPHTVSTMKWDQVWLTFSSDALRSDLANELLAAVGTATVVCLQPDLQDGNYVQTRVAPHQVVQGMIPFLSYQTPFPGQPGPQGIAYFLPPGMPTIVGIQPGNGSMERVHDVVGALRSGDLSAKAVQDFGRSTATAPALLQPLIAALELNDWNLNSLPTSANLNLGLAAAKEAIAVAATHTGASTTPLRILLQPLVWRMLLPIMRRFFPLDLETYLQYHFSKTAIQTRLMLENYATLAEEQGLSAVALTQLRQAMPSLPQHKPHRAEVR